MSIQLTCRACGEKRSVTDRHAGIAQGWQFITVESQLFVRYFVVCACQPGAKALEWVAAQVRAEYKGGKK